MASLQTNTHAGPNNAGYLSIASRAAPTKSYMLGNSSAELRRLTLQAAILRPITERLFREAGVTQGMRVLDLRCGPGDLSFLAAEIVGSSGRVIGIDQSPEAIALARLRARQKGIKNIDFEEIAVDDFSAPARFDAAVGRYVLAYQADPTAFIRHAKRFVRPYGVLALHEFSLRHPARSEPPVPLWNRVGDWLITAFRANAPGHDASTRLVEHFIAAGLQCPNLFAEILTAAGESSPLYAWAADTVQTVLPILATSGIATVQEVSIETLAERLRVAVVAANAQVEGPVQICGWARLPEAVA